MLSLKCLINRLIQLIPIVHCEIIQRSNFMFSASFFRFKYGQLFIVLKKYFLMFLYCS